MEPISLNYNNTGSSFEEIYADYWTFEENEMFERALANLPSQNISPVDLFEKIGEISIPGKTTDEIRAHLELLIHDVNLIESYDGSVSYRETVDQGVIGKNTAIKCPSTCPNAQKKKGIARWTKDEHEKFLLGLAKYGRRDWKSISRNIVTTKSPTQVASHAQKYFIRQAKQSSLSKNQTPVSNNSTFYTVCSLVGIEMNVAISEIHERFQS